MHPRCQDWAAQEKCAFLSLSMVRPWVKRSMLRHSKLGSSLLRQSMPDSSLERCTASITPGPAYYNKRCPHLKPHQTQHRPCQDCAPLSAAAALMRCRVPNQGWLATAKQQAARLQMSKCFASQGSTWIPGKAEKLPTTRAMLLEEEAATGDAQTG